MWALSHVHIFVNTTRCNLNSCCWTPLPPKIFPSCPPSVLTVCLHLSGYYILLLPFLLFLIFWAACLQGGDCSENDGMYLAVESVSITPILTTPVLHRLHISSSWSRGVFMFWVWWILQESQGIQVFCWLFRKMHWKAWKWGRLFQIGTEHIYGRPNKMDRVRRWQRMQVWAVHLWKMCSGWNRSKWPWVRIVFLMFKMDNSNTTFG